MNMTKENEINGIQLKLWRSTPIDVWYVYQLMTASPTEIPNVDMKNNLFRPARSTKNVHKIAPNICTTPTIIDETFDDSVDPERSKIVFVKLSIGKQPQAWWRAINKNP